MENNLEEKYKWFLNVAICFEIFEHKKSAERKINFLKNDLCVYEWCGIYLMKIRN